MRAYKGPTFQRRHYEWLAQWVQTLPTQDGVRETVREELCLALRGTNPGFDADRFREACIRKESP